MRRPDKYRALRRALLRRILAVSLPLAGVVAAGSAWLVYSLATPVAPALVATLVLVAAGAGVVAQALAVIRWQVSLARSTDAERDALTSQLLTAGKAAAVGEMSAGLAHEINNPLATIDTLRTWIADLAGSPPLSEADREEVLASAAKIGEQVERCKQITQGLLHFSRRDESRPGPVDLVNLLTELVVVERARARLAGVAIECDLQPLPELVAPPWQLQQIFMNLVNNAIDATADRREGHVAVRARSEAGVVRVEVADNGSGIPPQVLPQIFVPFFTTKPVGRGTGLGLPICSGLVRELGGTLQVTSRVGVGTTFSVTLPLPPSPRGS